MFWVGILHFDTLYASSQGFPDGSVVKNSPASAGETRSIPGLGRSPTGRNGNPLQYSCLEHPMDRPAWWVTVHGVAELDSTEQLSRHTVSQYQLMPPPAHFIKDYSTSFPVLLVRKVVFTHSVSLLPSHIALHGCSSSEGETAREKRKKNNRLYSDF